MSPSPPMSLFGGVETEEVGCAYYGDADCPSLAAYLFQLLQWWLQLLLQSSSYVAGSLSSSLSRMPSQLLQICVSLGGAVLLVLFVSLIYWRCRVSRYNTPGTLRGPQGPPLRHPVHAWEAFASASSPKYCCMCRELISGFLIYRNKGWECCICRRACHATCLAACDSLPCKTPAAPAAAAAAAAAATHGAAAPPVLKHRLVEGALAADAVCCCCGLACSSTFGLDGLRCLWCARTVHSECLYLLPTACDLGPLRLLMLPPAAVTPLLSAAASPHVLLRLAAALRDGGGVSAAIRGLRSMAMLLQQSVSRQMKRINASLMGSLRHARSGTQQQQPQQQPQQGEKPAKDDDVAAATEGLSAVADNARSNGDTILAAPGTAPLAERAVSGTPQSRDSGSSSTAGARGTDLGESENAGTPRRQQFFLQQHQSLERQRPQDILRALGRHLEGFKVLAGGVESSGSSTSFSGCSDGESSSSEYSRSSSRMSRTSCSQSSSHSSAQGIAQQQELQHDNKLRHRQPRGRKERSHIAETLPDSNGAARVETAASAAAASKHVSNSSSNGKKERVAQLQQALAEILPPKAPVWRLRAQPLRHLHAADATPVLVFVNCKSGGQVGRTLYKELLYRLNPLQVVDIQAEDGPERALHLFKPLALRRRLRVVVCGGDGTVGWVIDAIQKVYRAPENQQHQLQQQKVEQHQKEARETSTPKVQDLDEEEQQQQQHKQQAGYEPECQEQTQLHEQQVSHAPTVPTHYPVMKHPDHPQCRLCQEAPEVSNQQNRRQQQQEQPKQLSLQEQQKMKQPSAFVPVAICPLGTGNDLSNVLGWGMSFDGDIVEHLLKIRRAVPSVLDIWNVEVSGSSGPILSSTFSNYLDVGVAARIALKFHRLREGNPELFQSRLGNKFLYGEVGFRDFLGPRAAALEVRGLYCDGGVMLWGDAEPQQQRQLQHHEQFVLPQSHQVQQKYYRRARLATLGHGVSTDSSSSDIGVPRRHSQSHKRHRTTDVAASAAQSHAVGPEGATAVSAPPSPGQRLASPELAASTVGAVAPKPALHRTKEHTYMVLAADTATVAATDNCGALKSDCSNSVECAYEEEPDEFATEPNQHRKGPEQKRQQHQQQQHQQKQQHQGRSRRPRAYPASPHTHTAPGGRGNSLGFRDQQYMSAPHLGALTASVHRRHQLQQQRFDHWKPQKIDDGLIEVVAFKSLFHLGQVQVGLAKALRLCQGRSVCLHVSGSLPLQVDGEPQLLEGSCRIAITHK
ncbi:diacylglycerol kinase, putative [Eimeria tenella]|uniref:Diacylglycerol kinase n=1 Tax=Eimeria tenella TaxID=5802 RepID=U6L198_EIMTE|nr:diacylglycerol kinase, putative [Eimeria tenella]CDJ42963.1 diacylglycerol kinase, putative [Eimeria tenella]|eukprot:XP_013233713.1 diacylglycerol kinase, putative [Eimeria tenella]